MKRITAVALGILLALASAGTTLAAKPSREVIDLATPDGLAANSAFVTWLCGFDVVASGTARVTVHVFTDSSGEFRHEIDGYQIVETFTNESGVSVTLHDVGPDVIWVGDDGSLLDAITGRSLTGSGYIGRVVVESRHRRDAVDGGKERGVARGPDLRRTGAMRKPPG